MLIVHEDVKTLGLGAELSAVIMEERFDALDAPVMRVTYPDTHCAVLAGARSRPTCPTRQDHRRASQVGWLLTGY